MHVELKKKKKHYITGLPWWRRIHLPMQGLTPDLEDPTCPGTSKPPATATEPLLQSPRAATREALGCNC